MNFLWTYAHVYEMISVDVSRYILYSQVNGICGELRFPGREEVELAVSLQRRAVISPAFPSVASYQQSLIGAVKGE